MVVTFELPGSCSTLPGRSAIFFQSTLQGNDGVIIYWCLSTTAGG